MTVSTHVLDTARGCPAAGIEVALDRRAAGEATEEWTTLGAGRTDPDGRLGGLAPSALEPGVYRLRFATGPYFEAQAVQSLYPQVSVVFRVSDSDRHLHLPLLLSPFGFTTYRGR